MTTQPSGLIPVNTSIGTPVKSNADLTSIIKQLQSSANGTKISSAITSSSVLTEILNGAADLYASSGGKYGFAAIEISTTSPDATKYDPSHQTMVVGSNFIPTLSPLGARGADRKRLPRRFGTGTGRAHRLDRQRPGAVHRQAIAEAHGASVALPGEPIPGQMRTGQQRFSSTVRLSQA